MERCAGRQVALNLVFCAAVTMEVPDSVGQSRGVCLDLGTVPVSGLGGEPLQELNGAPFDRPPSLGSITCLMPCLARAQVAIAQLAVVW